MRAGELLAGSAGMIAAAVRSGAASASSMVEASLARIAAIDPALNAFTDIVGERASARDGVEIEAQSAARAETVIQLYVLRDLATATATGTATTAPPKQAVILSLITATASVATHRAAFDQVVAKLGLNPVPDAAAARPPSSKTPSTAQRPAEEQRR